MNVRLRVDLAYDGGPFAGFARQRDQRTVQGDLEAALGRLTGQEVATTCAGRTDRGVHALAQVVHFELDTSTSRAAGFVADLEAARGRLDRLLGGAVTVWRLRQVGAAFDARFSATSRQYRYRIADTPALDPLVRQVVWHVTGPLALRPMQRAARLLLGEHDFRSFCRAVPGRTTVRRLDTATVARRAVVIGGEVHVRLAGPAFCHQQVRSIVGCLVDVGRGQHEPEWLADVLASRDRAAASRLAPPHGLTLERVSYGHRWPAAPAL